MGLFKWEPLTSYEEQKVLQAITDAELETSGEVRLHMDKWCKTDPLYKAKNLFAHLGMDKTKERNGGSHIACFSSCCSFKYCIAVLIHLDMVRS